MSVLTSSCWDSYIDVGDRVRDRVGDRVVQAVQLSDAKNVVDI